MRTRTSRSLLLFLLCFIPALALAQRYTVTDLGPLSPTGINSWAQVVGNYGNNAYIWTKRGGMRSLGMLPGGTFSSAAAINDLGIVAGTANGPGTLISPFPEFPNVQCSDLTQPFIWAPGTGMQGLGVPQNLASAFFADGSNPDICIGASSHGRGIDNLSRIVGDVPDGPNLYAFALLWTRAKGMTAFGGSWPPTFGNGINNNGEIVGQNSEIQCQGRATTWKDGIETDLGNLAGGGFNYVSSATGINDLGLVVGWSTTSPVVGFSFPSPVHAVLWTQNRVARDFATLPGDTSSIASKINLFGQVIGSSGNADYTCEFGSSPFQVIGRPFIWTERRGMQDLNTLIRGNSGWILNTATDINVWGQIVGSGTRNGQPHGYLLTPVNPFKVF